MNLLHLCHGNDHRIHDTDISIIACTKDRAKLCLEDFRLCQADTDCTIAHCRVIFLIQIEIIHLFVGTDIQCTDNDFLACHILRNCFICLKLFFFCWKCIAL